MPACRPSQHYTRPRAARRFGQRRLPAPLGRPVRHMGDVFLTRRHTSRSERSTAPDSHCAAASRMNERKGASSCRVGGSARCSELCARRGPLVQSSPGQNGVRGGPALRVPSATLDPSCDRQGEHPQVRAEALLHLSQHVERQSCHRQRPSTGRQRWRGGHRLLHQWLPRGALRRQTVHGESLLHPVLCKRRRASRAWACQPVCCGPLCW